MKNTLDEYLDDSGQFSLKKWLNYQPRQEEFLRAVMEHRRVLFGGAKGPGKSYALRGNLVALHLMWAGMGYKNVKSGLFCESYTSLQDRHMAVMEYWPSEMGELRRDSKAGLGFFFTPLFGGGAILLRNITQAGTMKNASSRYKSAEFAAIAIDELTEIAERKTMEILVSSLRWPGISDTKFLAATNPDGIGMEWVRELWIEHKYPTTYKKAGIDKQFYFVPALPKDNQYLDKTYWEDLRAQDPDIQKAWIEGDWYVFSGRAFKHFDREVHVVDYFKPPDTWNKWTSHDYGLSAPYVALWFAKDPETGRIVVYKELQEVLESDALQARKIVTECEERELYGRHWADPHFWDSRPDSSNIGMLTSAADVYRSEGLYLTKGNNDRQSGKRTISSLLMNLPDGRPGLIITKNCRNVIRNLSNLQHDPSNPEDVYTTNKADDHAYDALRYGLSGEGMLAPKKKPVKDRVPIWSPAFDKYT